MVEEEVSMEASDSLTGGGGGEKTDGKKYFFDTVNIKVPRKGMEMTSFLRDGIGNNENFLIVL